MIYLSIASAFTVHACNHRLTMSSDPQTRSLLDEVFARRYGDGKKALSLQVEVMVVVVVVVVVVVGEKTRDRDRDRDRDANLYFFGERGGRSVMSSPKEGSVCHTND